jgi:hypothetical protein
MKRLFSALALLLFSFTLFAQDGTLRGKVLDERALPLPFVNVRLLPAGKGSQPLGATLTDSTGRFSLSLPQAGAYRVELTAIGFAPLKTDSFRVEGAGGIDLGSLVMKGDSAKLKEVSVTALRPTIVQLADRMVVSVEGTALAAGNSAFTLLAKSPGIFIDAEGNIQLNGRGSVTVMIDGRLTYLSARDLRNLLETTPAENIKSIEIITNPSARFDAEGNSGIINIVFRKNTVQGINGSVHASYNYNFFQHGATTGANVNLKKGRLNAFLNADLVRRVGGRNATFTRIFYGPQKTTYFDQSAVGNFTVTGPPSLRLGADFEIDGRNSIGALVNFNRSRGQQEFLTDTWIGNAPRTPFQFIDADNISSNIFTNITSNLHYTRKLDTGGTTLTVDLDYARITNDGEANFYNTFRNLVTGQDSIDNLYTLTPGGYQIYSARLDLTRPFQGGQKLELGAKTSRVLSDNDSRFFFNNGAKVIDPLRTNHFYYKESIYAAYLNWSMPLGKALTVQAGLRAEGTRSRGESFTTGQVTERNYLDFFPSVFVQQKVSANYGINYNYSRRLSRPNYGSLNPFRAYRDPYTWTEGNPFLRPQYTHLFNITQTFKKQYVLQLFYHLTKDVMAEIPILDVEKAVTVYTTGNVDDGHNMGAMAIVPVKLLKFWDTRNTAQLTYNRFSTVSNNGLLRNSQLSYSLQSVHTVLLPRDFRMELSFLFRGPAASGLYRMAPMNWIDVAFKKSFAKPKIDLTLTVTDIFKGYRYYWTTNIAGNVNEFDQYFRWRAIGFSIRYHFSRGQKVNVKQRAALEELNRT